MTLTGSERPINCGVISLTEFKAMRGTFTFKIYSRVLLE